MLRSSDVIREFLTNLPQENLRPYVRSYAERWRMTSEEFIREVFRRTIRVKELRPLNRPGWVDAMRAEPKEFIPIAPYFQYHRRTHYLAQFRHAVLLRFAGNLLPPSRRRAELIARIVEDWDEDYIRAIIIDEHNKLLESLANCDRKYLSA